MKQIFISGASIAYGVCGPNGGWADMLKLRLHNIQYGKKNVKEKFEIYNFSKSGYRINDVTDSLFHDIKYRRDENSESIIILSVGLNDTKSKLTPDNYVSSLDQYSQNLQDLFDVAKKISPTIFFVGYSQVNEKLVNPKVNLPPIGNSYFANERIKLFNDKCKELCKKNKIEHLDMFSSAPRNWNSYLSSDGLHPNNEGHKWIFNKVWGSVERYL